MRSFIQVAQLKGCQKLWELSFGRRKKKKQGVLDPLWLKFIIKVLMKPTGPSTAGQIGKPHTEKTIFPFPFTLNGI